MAYNSTFSPTIRNIGVVQEDLTDQNFDLKSVIWVLTGTVRKAGAGLPGVQMTGLPGNPITDSDGAYWAVVPGGTIIKAVPTKTGLCFDPPFRDYGAVVRGALNQIWTAVQPAVAGVVRTPGGTPVAGVQMTGLPDAASTSGDGNYQAIVPCHWAGTLVPVKAGYTFLPPARVYLDLTQELAGQDFLAQPITLMISGTARTGSGEGLAGVTLAGLPGEPVSGAGGDYSSTVPWGWSGTVSPVRAGYRFAPSQRTYQPGIENQGTQNFLGAPVTPKIENVEMHPAGILRFGVNGLPGDVYDLQSSTDLVVWETTCSVSSITGYVQFEEKVSAGQPFKFFRGSIR
jgi:hypothetical protein